MARQRASSPENRNPILAIRPPGKRPALPRPKRAATARLLNALHVVGFLTSLACSTETSTDGANNAGGGSGSAPNGGSTTLATGGDGPLGGSNGNTSGSPAGNSGSTAQTGGVSNAQTGGESSARGGSSPTAGNAANAGSSYAGNAATGGSRSMGGNATSAGSTSTGANGASGGSASTGGNAASGGSSSTAGNGASGGSASTGGNGASAGSSSDDHPAGYVPAIIGVGYGGLRIVSRDGGLSWGSRASIAAKGGDDDNLIRAIAYGKGRWIATGWRLWTSDDGVTWTDHGKLHDGIVSDQQIIEGLAYKDGYFYAAGDGSPSKLYRSPDGISWTRYATIGNTVKHTGLAYRGGVLVSYGDSHTSYQSSDGLSWTEMSGIQDATYCEGQWKSLKECFNAAWFDAGYYLLDEWGGFIRRSPNGQGFKNVYADDQQNTLYRSRALAQGFAAPR